MKLSLMIISLLLSGAVNAADTQNEELKDPQDLMIEMALEEMGMEGVDASQLSDADIEELEAFSKRGPGHDGRDPRYRDRPPRRGQPIRRPRPPRRGEPIHRPRPRPRPPVVVCVAENRRGMQFRGRGYSVWQAERRAIDDCRYYSRRGRSCYIRGCFRR